MKQGPGLTVFIYIIISFIAIPSYMYLILHRSFSVQAPRPLSRKKRHHPITPVSCLTITTTNSPKGASLSSWANQLSTLRGHPTRLIGHPVSILSFTKQHRPLSAPSCGTSQYRYDAPLTRARSSPPELVARGISRRWVHFTKSMLVWNQDHE